MLDCVRMSPWVSTCNPRPPAGEARVALGVDEAAFDRGCVVRALVSLVYPSNGADLANLAGVSKMKKISLVILASVALMSVGACAVGKGKGKAPPPAASPVITKG
jgi:hypothetical protein